MPLFMTHLKPAVPKSTLLLFSGAMWVAVGIMMGRFAFQWLSAVEGPLVYLLFGAGSAAAVVTSHLGFFRVVDKNLGRISRMKGRRCAFSFMSWKSYLLVLLMVAMGVALRHSPIPKPYLAVLYLGIGGGLALSSIRYFRRFISAVKAPSEDNDRDNNNP